MVTFWIYRVLTSLFGPLLPIFLLIRQIKGKEERVRRGERRGIPSIGRPQGKLIWVHVASVGESLSVLPLIERILHATPDAHVLVTSTTVTSATVMAKRLPERAFHQFVPVDRPSWVRRFYDHWDPDLCLIVESELWPNLLNTAKKRQKTCILINGRMSERSEKRWRKLSGFIGFLLDCFDLCLVQDQEQVERYRSLGAKRVVAAGNLKLVDNRKAQSRAEFSSKAVADPASQAIPLSRSARRAAAPAFSNRPVWLAASTHEGEEELVLDLHNRLRIASQDVLTILAPRHPARRNQIIDLLNQQNIPFVTRTSGATLEANHQVFLIDTIGELTDYFYIADVSLICGSLLPGVGGHNPVEAAQRETAVVLGPHMENFRVLTRDFLSAQAVRQGFTQDEIFQTLSQLMQDAEARQGLVDKANLYLAKHANVLDSILSHLSNFLEVAQLRVEVEAEHDTKGFDSAKVTPIQSAVKKKLS